MFASLDKAEEILSKQRYIAGSRFTEADLRLFVTLIRFDEVNALVVDPALRARLATASVPHPVLVTEAYVSPGNAHPDIKVVVPMLRQSWHCQISLASTSVPDLAC